MSEARSAASGAVGPRGARGGARPRGASRSPTLGPRARRARLAGAACALVALGCAPAEDDPLALGAAYVGDRAARRRALEESLVDPDNGYAAARLAHYATEATEDEESWDALPVWNPPVRPVTRADVGRFVGTPSRPSTAEEGALAPAHDEGALADPDAWTEEALIALGRRAFEVYPVQVNPTLGLAVEDEAHLARYGVYEDARGHLGGLVRVALADGSEGFAFTCASCHAAPDARGRLVHGAANAEFDYGALAHLASLRRGAPEEAIAHYLGWGAGQVDVTPDGVDNPTAMTDLRPVRHQPLLHWAGTLENDLVALAIRLETLIITSMGRAVRPPRVVTFALALYLYSLGEAGEPGDADAHPEGAALFTRHCGSCHGADGSTPRARVRIEDVGTEPSVGRSPTRGTGYYRTPSLWGVGERRQLLHDGRVESLEALLEPARLEEVPGHAYGTHLDPAERASLLAFARTIGALR